MSKFRGPRLWGVGACSTGDICPWGYPSDILHPTGSALSVHKALVGGCLEVLFEPSSHSLSKSLWALLGQKKLSAALEQGPRELWESVRGFLYSHATLGHGKLCDLIWHVTQPFLLWVFCFPGLIQEVKHRCPLFYKPTNMSEGSLTCPQGFVAEMDREWLTLFLGIYNIRLFFASPSALLSFRSTPTHHHPTSDPGTFL